MYDVQGHVVHAAKAAVEHTLQGVTSNLSSEENSKQMRERLNPSSDPDPPEFPPTLQDAISGMFWLQSLGLIAK